MAVLMVHGYLGGSNNFADLPERLARQGYFVRAMRLPGHGTSPFDLERTTVAEMEQAVLTELDTLRETHAKVVLLGHSMGGALSTLAASQRPAAGLVLVAPYFGVTHRWFYGMPPETWAKLLCPCVRWVYKPPALQSVNRKEVKRDIFTYPWVPTRSITMLMGLARRVNQPEVLDQIACPVLWLHSTGDRAASPETAERAFNVLPAAEKRRVTVEKSDHILCWDHDREEVATEIERFLGEVMES
jgi:carboxylesterase